MRTIPRFTPPCPILQFDPQTDERSPWVTACRHTFNDGVFKLIIPGGFRCDLASIPGPLLWLFGPNGRHQRAALFHDAGYQTQPTAIRSTIDQVFRAIMLDDGVPRWKAELMYVAVRLFGRSAWDRYAAVPSPMKAFGLAAERLLPCESDSTEAR